MEKKRHLQADCLVRESEGQQAALIKVQHFARGAPTDAASYRLRRRCVSTLRWDGTFLHNMLTLMTRSERWKKDRERTAMTKTSARQLSKKLDCGIVWEDKVDVIVLCIQQKKNHKLTPSSIPPRNARNKQNKNKQKEKEEKRWKWI